jgi:putative endonuclease
MFSPLMLLADLARDRGRRRAWHPDLATGRRGEDIAHRFLQRAGMTVVARNHRPQSGSGEVDLIGWEGDALVFVEVKSRRSEEHGPPDRAIGEDKIDALLRVARDYARRADVPWESVRFDVVTVVFATPPVVTHFRNVLPKSRPSRG